MDLPGPVRAGGRRSQAKGAALRVLRNEASHPTQQRLFTPGMAIALLDDVAGEINGLLGGQKPDGTA
jgi:hypothetical protein